jgi:hypothetical protein
MEAGYEMNRHGKNRYLALGLLVLLLSTSVPADGGSAKLSRSYLLKEDVTLEIGAEIDPTLKLDTVRFLLGRKEGMRRFLQSGQPRVEVAISNTGEESRRLGIAVALTDEDGALLAVASGGSRLLPVRSNEQATYVLKFKDVNRHLAGAVRFLIIVETR